VDTTEITEVVQDLVEATDGNFKLIIKKATLLIKGSFLFTLDNDSVFAILNS
jgi:hypothetical protein